MYTNAQTITKFDGDTRFLSNFADSPLTYRGVSYLNAEAAFQAQKSRTPEDFATLPPNEAKARGRKVPLPYDWEEKKYNIMREVVETKFHQNPDLARMLLNTGNKYLEEGNTWHDNIWGVCTCNKCKGRKGRNVLGYTLMLVREELRYEMAVSSGDD